MSISKILESSFRRFAFFAAAALIRLFTGVPVCAQLQVTEVMVDPLDENVWEWIEVFNPDGAIDLHGAFGDRLGDPRILPTDPPSIDNAKASDTMIPAGGTAVLYDANLGVGNPANFDDDVFRDAWGLSPSVPLIGVDFFPTLSNGGSSIGFWQNISDYELDLIDPGSGNLIVNSFEHALFGIDFRSGFPVAPNGTSMSFNGQGSYQSGVNWTISGSGVQGAVTSVPASIPGPINSTSDLASPGFQPAGGFLSELIITELMASPASNEPDWEWIEVFNGGAPINFADPNTKYVLDDTDGDDLLAANITSGSIPSDTTAVLYNGDALSLENMQAAWDPNSSGTNFIAVSDFSELATTGTVALWESLTDYLAEPTTGPNRTTVNAVTALNGYDNGGDWPSFNGVSSIFLTDLSADPNDEFYGFSWAQSALGDPNFPAFHASQAMGGMEVHAGGDVGSPGTFVELNADFDNDNDVDGEDFLIWQRGLGIGSSHATGDANGDGIVNGADLALWESQYGLTFFNADFDNDNDVDGDDLLVWQRGFQVGTTHAAGDANGDGIVNGVDLAIWKAQYGTLLPLSASLGAPLSASLGGSSSAVPEPTSLVLLALALAGWPRYSRRKCLGKQPHPQ